LLWYVPYLGMIVASRVGLQQPVAIGDAGGGAPVLRSARIASEPLVAYALALPVMHFALHATGLPSPVARSGRETLVLVLLLVLGGMALLQQVRFSRRRNALLEELGQARQELGTVEHDFNNALMAMRAAVLDRVFEPRVTTKGEPAGTGLGLASARQIAREAGGEILVERSSSEGTEFVVLLPWADGAREDAVERTMLVVDDDPTVLEVVRGLLVRAGLTVLSTGSANEAVRMIEAGDTPIRYLLTDVMMPEMDGVELADRIGRIQPHLAVLFMSGASTSTPVVERAVATGDGFLAKPFGGKELFAALAMLGVDVAEGSGGHMADPDGSRRPGVGSVATPG
jgi:CheY-like chemotaxis protein